MPAASTQRAGLLDGRPVGRWTHTFSRCPVSVAVRSEAKLSPTTKQNDKKGGYWDTKTIRRVSTCLARRPESDSIHRRTWCRAGEDGRNPQRVSIAGPVGGV